MKRIITTALFICLTCFAFGQNKKIVSYESVSKIYYFKIRPNGYTPTQTNTPQKQTSDKVTKYSDVDINIPINDYNNKNCFVLIIANENYKRLEPVPYALNDGSIFKEYCNKTLGVPEKNIHYIKDATLGDMRSEVMWIKKVMDAYKGEAKAIVYYAGHGIPDDSTKESYLVPIDGNGTDINTAYSLNDIYSTIGNSAASNITYFIDACFSGSNREEGMLASARAVAIKAKAGVLQGNAVAFTASSEDQTAFAFDEKRHGMFTYFLLKKLQETKGNVSYKELADYIRDEVVKESIVGKSKEQTPTVISSASNSTTWHKWKIAY